MMKRVCVLCVFGLAALPLILSADPIKKRTEVTSNYKLVRTIPACRLNLTDKTAITFEESAKGAPSAIKTWFYPGDNWGRKFVYGKAKELRVAEAMPAPQPPAPRPRPPEPRPRPPEPRPSPPGPPRPRLA